MSSLDKANVILARFKRHGIEPGTNYATVYDALLAMLDVADNAYNAGRRYQREVDAEIAETKADEWQESESGKWPEMQKNAEAGCRSVEYAIREQKID